MAVDALITAMDFYIEQDRALPLPSPTRRGETIVALPLSISTKVALLGLVKEKQVRPAHLAKAMGIKPQEVTRLLDLHHATKIDTVAAAFRALDKRLEFQVA
jgi:antitoxin HicB